MQKTDDAGRTALLVIELGSGTAILHGEEVELPLREFRLLAELARRVGEPIASEELIPAVWPDEPWTPKENLYILVTRLRRLIDGSTEFGKSIRNRRGFGYLLDLEADQVVVVDPAATKAPGEVVISLDDPSVESESLSEPLPTAESDETSDDQPAGAQTDRPDEEVSGPGRPRGVRVVTVAAAIVLTSAVAWASGYFISDRLATQRASTTSGSEKPDERAAEVSQSDRRSGKDDARRKQSSNDRRGRREKGAPGSAGNSGPAIAVGPPTIDYSDPATPEQESAQGSRKTSDKEQTQPEPALPPAPTRYLYHLYNPETGDHFVTTDGNTASTYEAKGYDQGGAIGRVYSSANENPDQTRGLTTNYGKAYIFVSKQPRTEPAMATWPLWYSTNDDGDFFYTTSQDEAEQNGWRAEFMGYVGTL